MASRHQDALATLARELSHARGVPSTRRDDLWQLSQEIARSLDALLERARGLPAAMHEETLRAARELLVVQISVFDELIELSRTEPLGGDDIARVAYATRPPPPNALPPSKGRRHQSGDAWLKPHSGAALNGLLGRVADMGSLSRPTVAKLGAGVTVAASLIFWLSWSGSQTNGQSGAAVPQELRSGAVTTSSIADGETAFNAKAFHERAPHEPGSSETASLGAGPGRDHEVNAGHVGGTMGAAETSPGATPMGASLLGAEVDPSMISTPRPASDAQAMSPSTSSAYSAPATRSADAPGATHADREATNVAVWTELPRPAAAVGVPNTPRPPVAAKPDTDTPLTGRVPSAQVAVPPPKVEAPQRVDSPTKAALQPDRGAGKAPPSQKWAVATVPSAPSAAAPRYASMFMTLKDGAAALQIFEDLKIRHAEVLADKRGELRSYVGSDGQTWYRVVALPAGTEVEATKICQSMGSEGHALGCTVARQ